ncbi:Acyl dehydratase [Nakamurella panacisegetis]|uniref:Acyl dehydratase n=1 Tax=Nakamurella panacisegetis TaxID=1090615 RepID=A0A1H0LC72_9ACTN|nr:MaoC family dehydratase [Nakamurella panacisegetis]SDO65646.1 Acyl dehydratase [Nakamurella panacisegetis]
MTLNETDRVVPTIIDLADLPDASDLAIGPSSWWTVDQKRINGFADVTGDHQWIHVEPERAAGGPFGGTIAHGYLTLSLVPPLLNEILLITSRSSGVNYGMDRIRFINPVRVDSQVRLSGKIVRADRRETGVRVAVALQMEIRGQEKLAMVGDFVILALP